MSNIEIKEKLSKTAGQIGEIISELLLGNRELPVDYVRGKLNELHNLCHRLHNEISGIDVITIAPSEGPINISTPGIVDEEKLRASAPSVDVPVNRF